MNVPHIRQELDYSCLPACVRMILAYYDDQRQESELRRLLKTRITGTSPANVMLRLPDIGYEAIVMDASRLILRKHIAAGQPCIAHVWTSPLHYWDVGVVHAVVVTEISEEAVWINDPILDSGPIAIPQDDFFRAWAATGHTLIWISPR